MQIVWCVFCFCFFKFCPDFTVALIGMSFACAGHRSLNANFLCSFPSCRTMTPNMARARIRCCCSSNKSIVCWRENRRRRAPFAICNSRIERMQGVTNETFTASKLTYCTATVRSYRRKSVHKYRSRPRFESACPTHPPSGITPNRRIIAAY